MIVRQFCIKDGHSFIFVTERENGSFSIARSMDRQTETVLSKRMFFMLADSNTIPRETGEAVRNFLAQEEETNREKRAFSNKKTKKGFSMVPLE